MDKSTTVLLIIATLLLACYLNNETNSKIDKVNTSYMNNLLRKDMIEGFVEEKIEEMKDKIGDKIEEKIEEKIDEKVEEVKEEIEKDDSEKDEKISKEMKKELEESHSSCPHMGGNTNKISCIQYPPMNTGFLLSLCCGKCLSEIQTDLNKGEKERKFKIEQKGDKYYFHGKKGKQLVLKCSPENAKILQKITGNDI
jgi:hypothetical protein